MNNLLEMLMSLLRNGGFDQIAKLVGLSGDASKTQSAIQGAAATLLTGLLQKASTPTGAQAVFDLVKDKKYDGSLLDQLPDILGDPRKAEDTIRQGSDTVTDIFGPKADAVSSALGSILGLGKSVLGPLLGLLAPLLLNLIGKQVLSKALNPQALLSLLLGQKDFLKSALPQGLTSALGVANFDDLGRTVAAATSAPRAPVTETRPTTAPVVEETPPFLKYLLPLGLLALLGLGGYYAMQSCSAPEERVDDGVAPRTNVTATNPDPAVKTKATDAVDSINKGVANATAALASLDLPGGSKIEVPQGGVLEQFVTYLKGGSLDLTRVFHLDVLGFDAGSTTPNATSLVVLNVLSKILTAFPNVEIKLTGPAAKVAAIRDELVKLSVGAARITTEERADPDRIELSVTKL